jgi:hypothetical protein
LLSCAKNSVKILIGRKTYFTPRDVFFKLLVRQLIGYRPINKVTCDGFTGEGAGSQTLMMMNAINFARVCGLTYVHTPFKAIAHADRPMEEWVAGWEKLFNLGAGELVCDAHDRDVVNFAYNFPDLIRCFGVHDLVRVFTSTIPEFKRKYYTNKPPRANDVLTIAIHVRRGDVSTTRADMWTSTEIVLKTTAKAKSIVESYGLSCRIHVFSQGNGTEFSGLRQLGAELFLNVDAIRTMQELIESDVLIMAKSSFSYLAAILCDGIKVYEPCDYYPLDGWVVREPDGDFDTHRFERQLHNLRGSKLQHNAHSWS